MIKSLEEFSKILALAGISSSQEEQILPVVKNISTSLEAIDETKQHEPHPQDDLQTSSDFPCQVVDEIKESCTTSDAERPLVPEIEKFLLCLLTNPICINHSGLCGMTKEDGKHCLNEQVDQEHHSYIESWFTTIFEPHHSFLLQLLVSHHSQQLVFHALMNCNVSISNLSMNASLYLIRTWLHWKYSFT